MRVALVFDNFGPYHMARLEAASAHMNVLGVEVAASSEEYDWDNRQAQGFEHVRLLDDASGRRDASLLEAAYLKQVRPWCPDVIALPGWSSHAALIGARWAANSRVPAILMSDSNANDMTRYAPLEFLKRRVVKLFQAGLCAGSRARSYLIDLGFPPNRIFMGYDVVDNDHFASGSDIVRATGVSPPPIDPAWRGRYFLANARFVPKKNLPHLIEAYARFRQKLGGRWPLVLIGDGPMRGKLKQKIMKLGLETSLIMPGFIQYDKLPLYYGTAGVFIHASTTEQWGLVINEAMASSLPILVSNRCGCVPELVEDGRNGYTFDPQDTDALALLMAEISSEKCDRSAMGRASSAIIARWSLQTFAQSLIQAVSAAFDPPLRKPRLLDQVLLLALANR